jgi:hypothetical protein
MSNQEEIVNFCFSIGELEGKALRDRAFERDRMRRAYSPFCHAFPIS